MNQNKVDLFDLDIDVTTEVQQDENSVASDILSKVICTLITCTVEVK